MNNAATPKPGRFEEEWAKLDLAPEVMRGKAEIQEASLILTSVKPELMVGGTLQTRTMLAPFGCEEVKVVQERIQDETMGEEAVDRKSLHNRIPIRLRKRTTRPRQAGCPAWTSTSSATLKTAQTR